MGRFGVLPSAGLVMLLMAGVAAAQAVTAPGAPVVPEVAAGPVAPAAELAWQDVITGQIEAFRAHDAPAAFSYAAAPFQTAFPSAEAFFVAIIGSGYAAIMDSSSHSFGAFTQLDTKSVAQTVLLIGRDLSRYEAIYILVEEERGWRVSGVQLAKQPGIGI
jgi:hypothetical protein